MQPKKYLLVIALAAVVISSCTRSASGDSTAVTPFPTSGFTNPLPTDSEPMNQVQEYATATALAKTAIAGGGQVATPTPTVTNGGTTTTPASALPEDIVPSSTPLIVPSSTPGFGDSGGSTPQPTLPVTGRPATYTLQSGEHPYCIARRYNVDPDELLSLSGLTRDQADSLAAGTVLRIPQTGSFPGERALRPHPTTYTVTSPDETFYSIACIFGDVDPAQIAQANGLALGSPLTIGQTIKIP